MHPKSTRFGARLLIPCDWCGALHARGTSDRYRRQTRYFCSQPCQHTAERARWAGPARAARFWSEVSIADPCWLRPNGARGTMGYGFIVVAGKRIPSHRFAWEDRTRSPIPTGFLVCHTCDVPTCVRNDDAGTYEVNGVLRLRYGHLWLGTHDDNMADRTAKGRVPKGALSPSTLHPERMARGARHGSKTHPERLRRGEAIHCAKLTESDVREIRARRAAGERYKTIAADKDVTAALCCSIALRQVWKHVD